MNVTQIMDGSQNASTSDLYLAFRNGNYSLSKTLLAEFDSANQELANFVVKITARVYGDTLLHLACQHGWLDIVKCLIEVYGCSPNINNKWNQKPLHYACRHGHLNVVQYLISEQECDVTATTMRSWTPLHYACRNGHRRLVEYLTCIPNVLRYVDQPSIVCLTLKYYQSDILMCLMDKRGFTPDLSETTGEQIPELLVTACQNNIIPIVVVHKLLIGISNYQNIELEHCKLVFMFCCKLGLSDILKQLTRQVSKLSHTIDSSGKAGIHYACQKGHTAIVQHLVEKCGCNIDARDQDGLTPLHIACKYGQNVDLVKYILSRSECDTLAKTCDGSMALHFACVTEKFDSQLTDALLKHGASMSKETLSLVQIYLRSSELEANEPTVKSTIVSYLLDFGKCDPNVKNYAGFTPVQISTYPFIVRAIVDCHAKTSFYKCIECENECYVVQQIKCGVSKTELDLSETASNGDSVLHMACVANRVLIAKCLLNDCNFDANIKNSTGDTPLMLALRFYTYRMLPEDMNNLTSLVSVFVNNAIWSCGLAEKDKDGNTLFHLACQANQHELISALEEADYSLKFTRNDDGYMPLELLSDPKLVVDYVVKGEFTYTFKPGTVHQLIWFCKNIDVRQVEHFLFEPSNKIKWGHEKKINCHSEHFMLHLPSHQVWLLLVVCFHSQTSQQLQGTKTFDTEHMFVIDIIDYLKDSSFSGGETTAKLLYIACRTNRYHFVEYLQKTNPKLNFDPIKLTNDIDIVQLLVLHGANKMHPYDINRMLENRVVHPDFFRTLKETNQWFPGLRCSDKEDTALHLSIQHHQYEVAHYLLTEAKCNPNVKNVRRETPVQLLISSKVWSDSECITIINVLMSTRLWDPNSKCNSNGDTALHLSVWQYRYEVAHYLLSKCECDPNIRNKRGEAPLQMLMSDYYWTDSKCFYLTKALMSTRKWNPNSSCNSKMDTALHLSVWYHRYKVAHYLLTEGMCDPSVINQDGRQPISMVMSVKSWTDSECINILKVFLSTGRWNPNLSCNSKMDTALHLSVWYHRYKVAHYLLSEVKCDPNVINEDGRQPLSMVMSVKSWTDSECIKIIQDLKSTGKWDPNSSCNSKKDTALHLAVKHYRYKVVLCLLSETILCNPNVKNQDDRQPISMTLSIKSWTDSECIKIIQVLVSTRLWEINSTCNFKGDTALHLSIKHHRCEVAYCLLSHAKCDPNIKNLTGDTAFQLLMTTHKWSDSECINVIKVLKSRVGWDPNSSCNSKGDTALHLSIWYHRYQIVLYLLANAKCDPSSINLDGDKPIHLLLTVKLWSDSECLDIIEALMSAGQLDPNSSCNSEGDSALHLSVKHCRPVVVHYLLSKTKCDPNITNVYKETPLQVANKISVINDLIRHGANLQNVYEFIGKSVGLRKPLIPPVKVLIIGNSGVGKSTLTEALKIETSNFILLRALTTPKKVSGVDEKTTGIVPHEFESKLYGRVIFYDFAGHREFYNSHIAILQSVIKTSPIFLIVVNLSNSEEEVKRNIQYWLSFTENNCYTTQCKPHIIIIGSHADIAFSRGEDPHYTVSKMSNYIQKITQDFSLVYLGMYPIDCRYPDSTSMDKLRSRLKDSCGILRKPNTISFNAHCFHVFLLDKFSMSVAVTIDDLRNEIENTVDCNEIGVTNYLPDSISSLSSVCDELNDRGHILFLKNNDNLERSWVIIDKVSLLSKVTGTIFAPNDFKEHCQIAESTGVVPLSRLIEKFPDYKSEVLIGFLAHLEFCHEIDDCELRELISKHQDSLNRADVTQSENERYFLFPGLITLNAPRGIWNRNFNFKYHSFWIIRCTRQDQFFSSRFTQVLLLRLAFSFALIKIEIDQSIPALQRECSIWKNGIFWGEMFGMETIVEIHSSIVILLMRYQERNLLHCIGQRSSIIQKILQCVHDLCTTIETVESFIDPSEATEFPLKSPVSPETPQFSLQKIAEAIVKSTEYDSPSVVSSTGTISLDYLLTFDPYAEVGIAALIKLCNRENDSKKEVSDGFLQRLSCKLSKKSKLFIKLFNSSSAPSHLSPTTSEDLFTKLKKWRDECNGTYKCLKQKLDQFSVFAGRNVLVSKLLSYMHMLIIATLCLLRVLDMLFSLFYRSCLLLKYLKRTQK